MSMDALVRSIAISIDQPMLVFLGAGASLSSGMPSATQCIWEWKRSIFLTNNPGLEKQFSELSLPSVKEKIQSWLDRQRRYPPNGHPDEYSIYIEECYARSEDRRRFFERWVRSANPAVGYQLLAELAKQGLIASVWSTNFDGLTARAAISIGQTVVEIGKDSKERISRPLASGELQCVSLHGDYRYDKLMNTVEEIKEQEAELRSALIKMMQSYPVLVCGYSGRDASVMAAFLTAYKEPSEQRLPLFWTQYGDSDPSGDLAILLDVKQGADPERFLINGVTFDELIRRVALHIAEGDGRKRVEAILDRFKESPLSQRLPFKLPILPVTGVIKSNAHPIVPPGELLEFDLVRWPDKGEVYATLRRIGDENGFVCAPFKGKVYAIADISQIKNALGVNLLGDVRRVPLNNEDLRYEDGAGNQLIRRAIVLALAARSRLSTDGDGLIWNSSNHKVERIGSESYKVHSAVLVQVKSLSKELIMVLKPTLYVTDLGGREADRIAGNAIKVRILGYQHNSQFNEALRFWTDRFFTDSQVVLRYPDNDGGAKFSIIRRPLFAKITDDRDRSIRIDEKIEKRATQVGLQISEPRLTFLPRSGAGVLEETHPIRGLLNGRPYDALLSENGVATNIRIAVIAPKVDQKRIISFLSRLQQSSQPTKWDADYLLPFQGFSAAFKCGLEISQGGAGFVGLPEPSDMSTRSAREIGSQIAAAISSLKASVNPSLTFIYVPDRWGPLKAYENEAENFDLHDFVKAAAIPQGCATQFIEEETINHPQQCRVMWWLSLATYAKAMRSPWALHGLDKDSAYVGIGYSLRYKPGQENGVVLGCSHLYSPNGLGLQFRLNKLENPVIRRKNPFMSFDDARRLGENIRELFFEANMKLPRRVVIHKQTPFLKQEREGLQAGLNGIDCVDLLQIHIDDTLRYVASKPNNQGGLEIDNYPIHRGTTVVVDDFTALLWVHGVSKALDPKRPYYQGKRRIPAPLVLTRHAGTSDLVMLAEEILGLSKMNFNSFDLYGRLPATIETSRRVAKIGALLDRYAERSYDYRLFM